MKMFSAILGIFVVGSVVFWFFTKDVAVGEEQNTTQATMQKPSGPDYQKMASKQGEIAKEIVRKSKNFLEDKTITKDTDRGEEISWSLMGALDNVLVVKVGTGKAGQKLYCSVTNGRSDKNMTETLTSGSLGEVVLGVLPDGYKVKSCGISDGGSLSDVDRKRSNGYSNPKSGQEKGDVEEDIFFELGIE